MARGLDKEKKGGTPPRRNPFQQKIKSKKELEAASREAKAARQRAAEQKKKEAEAQESGKAEDRVTSPVPKSTRPANADLDRARLLHGLPLNVLDPLSGAQGFEYILDSSQADDLNHTYLRSSFEFVSWREPKKRADDPLGEYSGILYQEETPVALVTYDEASQSFVLYGQDPYSGQAQEIISITTLESGFLGRIKVNRGYQENPGRALAQDINDFIEAVELGQTLMDNPFPSQGSSLYGPATIAAGIVLSASRINMPHDN